MFRSPMVPIDVFNRFVTSSLFAIVALLAAALPLLAATAAMCGGKKKESGTIQTASVSDKPKSDSGQKAPETSKVASEPSAPPPAPAAVVVEKKTLPVAPPPQTTPAALPVPAVPPTSSDAKATSKEPVKASKESSKRSKRREEKKSPKEPEEGQKSAKNDDKDDEPMVKMTPKIEAEAEPKTDLESHNDEKQSKKGKTKRRSSVANREDKPETSGYAY